MLALQVGDDLFLFFVQRKYPRAGVLHGVDLNTIVFQSGVGFVYKTINFLEMLKLTNYQIGIYLCDLELIFVKMLIDALYFAANVFVADRIEAFI